MMAETDSLEEISSLSNSEEEEESLSILLANSAKPIKGLKKS
jgi:hypothetical protein